MLEWTIAHRSRTNIGIWHYKRKPHGPVSVRLIPRSNLAGRAYPLVVNKYWLLMRKCMEIITNFSLLTRPIRVMDANRGLQLNLLKFLVLTRKRSIRFKKKEKNHVILHINKIISVITEYEYIGMIWPLYIMYMGKIFPPHLQMHTLIPELIVLFIHIMDSKQYCY